jgi:hypothetical protein
LLDFFIQEGIGINVDTDWPDISYYTSHYSSATKKY